MRHATVYAIEEVMLGRRFKSVPDHNWIHASAVTACSWEQLPDGGYTSGHFNDYRAIHLMRGEKVDLPTCPMCALLLDEALRLAGLTGGENVEATVSP